jgi:thiosulfate/3-mercaptopyruvate sulfurtransferase
MNRTILFALSSLLASIAAAPAVADPRPAAPTRAGAGGPEARPGAAQPTAAPAARPRGTDPAALPLLVSPAWLATHLEDRDLVLLHVGDLDGFRARHIAGARAVSLSDISVSMQGAKGLHLELPPTEDLRHRLEALGISNDSRIVVYFADDWVSPATRVVLTLDAAGLGDHAALLDGGMPAWLRDGHAVGDAAPPARTGKLAPLTLRPIVVEATTVVSSLGKPGFAVVDARDRVFYDGTETGRTHDRQHRTGHITGALSIPYDSVFDEQLVLRSPEDLRARFTQAGVKPGDTVIGYCHIGQQATAMLFAARRLGHPVLLYDGSFEDWSLFHPGYPVERTPEKAADKAKDGAVEKALQAPGKASDKAPDKASAAAKPAGPAGRP